MMIPLPSRRIASLVAEVPQWSQTDRARPGSEADSFMKANPRRAGRSGAGVDLVTKEVNYEADVACRASAPVVIRIWRGSSGSRSAPGSFASILVCPQPVRLRCNLGGADCPDFTVEGSRLNVIQATPIAIVALSVGGRLASATGSWMPWPPVTRIAKSATLTSFFCPSCQSAAHLGRCVVGQIKPMLLPVPLLIKRGA